MHYKWDRSIFSLDAHSIFVNTGNKMEKEEETAEAKKKMEKEKEGFTEEK